MSGDFLGAEGTIISNNEDVAYMGDMREDC
jgi:hypothetical protein